MEKGIAGHIAEKFINSKLTPLLMIAFLAIGIYTAYLTPREEEPQIDVPIADIFINYPGASSVEVESRVVNPLERILTNIPGVEYVYSTSSPGRAFLVIRFYVGEDVERSLVKMYNEIEKHMDQMPAGVGLPLIKSRSIDDVPVLGLTLWSQYYSDYELRQIAQELVTEIEKVEDVANTGIIGGRSRQVRVNVDRQRLAGYNLDLLSISRKIQEANQQVTSGAFRTADTEYLVETGEFLKSVEDVSTLVVGVFNDNPVYLHQVAQLVDGPEIPKQYVSFGFGRGSQDSISRYPGEYPAVTISIAKRKGADAMRLAERVWGKVKILEGFLVPQDVKISISRNYGETASDKVAELLTHLVAAILAVTLVVGLAMGWRGGLVVFLSVPITFALTLFIYYMFGYTLNRITLFALVFVTGIVVDDSIIIAENMHRHFRMKKLPFFQAALASINEVGNPTILATFTVIAAVLPMAFVSGLMGPYMSPMPIGASMAMIFSLIVALMITPWLAYRLLRHEEKKTEKSFQLEDTKIYKWYAHAINPLLNSVWKRWTFIGGVVLLLMGSMLLLYFKLVAVKMLPFDNKNEFQVIIDMPEGTTLERTAGVTREIAAYLRQQPEVVHYQSYAGTASPINFNGLVRHYDLRKGSHVSDIQVNLKSKSDRNQQSHQIAKKFRPGILEIAGNYGANVKIVEVPPGPPVISTLVAEIYGPEYEQQIALADQVKDIFRKTEDVVDVDWMVEADQTEFYFSVDKEKAGLSGVTTERIVQTITTALKGNSVARLYEERAREGVDIVVQLPEAERSSITDLMGLEVLSDSGQLVSVGDMIRVENRFQDKSIYHKNQKRVVYVLGDVAGRLESPVYAIMNISDQLNQIELPEGYGLEEHYTTKTPFLEEDFSVKWDGEWHITYEVFRDLGAAFAVVLVIIYLLIVGWFQDFKVPVVMMIAIPLSLVGILVGHWLLGAFFTATSMIGMIALAGIMVRNAILLIDFINLRLEDGIPLKKAVVEAGAVRTTPILLTAGTVVIGAFVIFFDPIFQGLAISLMGGAIASTALTLLMVPLIYYLTERGLQNGKTDNNGRIHVEQGFDTAEHDDEKLLKTE